MELPNSNTTNLLPEIMDMSIYDATDEIYKRCDQIYNSQAYPSIVSTLNASEILHPYYQSYFSCYTQNLKQYLVYHNLTYDINDNLNNKIASIFDFYKYLIFPIVLTGLFFCCLNMKIFISKKTMRTPFGALTFVQSLTTLVFFIFAILANIFYFGKYGMFSLNFTLPDWLVAATDPAWTYFSHTDRIALVTLIMIRFYKATLRLLGLVCPIWYYKHLRIRGVLVICVITIVIIFVFMVIVVLKIYGIYPFRQPITDCLILADEPFNFYSWSCIPEYVTYPGELFGLCFVIALIDIAAIINYTYYCNRMTQEMIMKEKVYTKIIQIDLAYLSFIILRYAISIAWQQQHNGIWFRYNSRLGAIITVLYGISRHQIDGWRPMFFMVEILASIRLHPRLASSYASQEDHDNRRQVFAANLVRIVAAQAKGKAQNSNVKYGINSLADETPEEFAARFHGNEHHFLAPSTNAQERSQNQRVFRREAKLNSKFKRQANTVAYTTFDYNANGGVTPVKDQGVCGGTHAFIFTGLMESAILRKYGINTSLSEQEILDCAGTYNQGNWDNAGCSGGNLYSPLIWSVSNGVVNETIYPYTQAAFVNGTNGTCNWSLVNNTSVRQYHATGWAVWTPAYGGYTSGTLPNNATTDQRLVFNLQTIGPLSQPIYVTWDFQYYLDGIWNPTDQDCIGNVGLHAMIITGYGYGNESSNLYYTDNTTTQNFWISKNSFGTGWGINGYMYVIKDSPNLCTQNSNRSSTFDYIGVAANFTGN